MGNLKNIVLAICLGGAILSLSNNLSASEGKILMLATTTSLDNTGLLDVLADAFKAKTGIKLNWVAVGTGQAIKLAKDGNADVVLVHAKKAEEKFMKDGYGVNRRVIARNYFMVVGPENDPAQVAKAKDIKEALLLIKNSSSPFISRGDKSGTHLRELELWNLVGGKPGKNYMETGQGMAQTLRVTMEKQGYTLTDSATFYGVEGIKGLKVFIEKTPELENIYAVIVVNPFKIKTTNYFYAMEFVAFLTSPEGQRIIRDFKNKNSLGLFEPMADKEGIDLSK